MSSGMALPVASLQRAYDLSPGAASGLPDITVNATRGAVQIQDAATTIGQLFELRDGLGVNKWEVDLDAATGRGGIRHLPTDYTMTTLPVVTYALQWDSIVTTNVPGGAPFGNDTAPAMVGAIGECIFADPGNLFSSALLFNQGTQITAQANIGPIYTMVNQPRMRADGGAFSVSQHNALRIQPGWGPNLAGGSITQTSAQYILNVATVDATVGAASVTTLEYWVAGGVTLTAGGTVGTLNCSHYTNITGPTTLRGIFSEMSSGTFIDHVGTAPSNWAGQQFMNNGIAMNFGTTGGNRVQLLRSAAGVLRMIGAGGTNNEGLDFDMDDATANNITLRSSTGAGIQMDFVEMSFGTSATGGANNWQFLFAPGARTYAIGGSDVARRLFTAAANLTLNAAFTNAFTDIVNEPGLTGSTAPTNAGNMLIQTAPSFGDNRYGLLITSNPSGGTLNYAFRQSNASALARFDGRLDINRGIALGGGAAATLGTIGGTGPTAAAQAQWVEIDIGGVAHWLPAWT